MKQNKSSEEKAKTKLKNWILGIFLIVATLPSVLAYSTGWNLPTIWDVLVEDLFGSFWGAVVFLMLIFFVILSLGGISFYTVLIFEMYFFLAMSIGYGYAIFVFPVLVASVIYFIWQVIKLFLENR